MKAYELRAARADDLEITYKITEDAMRPYVEQTWGRWDDAEQLAKHRANFTPEHYRLIVVDQKIAGLVVVEHLPTHDWLVKLYLRQAYRGAGIGSAVLRGVIAAAGARAQPVRLRVLRVNVRARALYTRYGFAIIEETPERFIMERPAA